MYWYFKKKKNLIVQSSGQNKESKVYPSTTICVDRQNNRVVITLQDGQVIHTTTETARLIQIWENRIIRGIEPYTMERLINYARTYSSIEELSVLSHARYHGFIIREKLTDPVRLNVGGRGFELSRSFLISHFDYFRAMLTSFAEAKQEKDIFIDRDYVLFQRVLDYISTGSASHYLTEGVSDELLFYMYSGGKEIVVPKQSPNRNNKHRDVPVLPSADEIRHVKTLSQLDERDVWRIVKYTIDDIHRRIKKGSMYLKKPTELYIPYKTFNVDQAQKVIELLSDLGYKVEWNPAHVHKFLIDW